MYTEAYNMQRLSCWLEVPRASSHHSVASGPGGNMLEFINGVRMNPWMIIDVEEVDDMLIDVVCLIIGELKQLTVVVNYWLNKLMVG